MEISPGRNHVGKKEKIWRNPKEETMKEKLRGRGLEENPGGRNNEEKKEKKLVKAMRTIPELETPKKISRDNNSERKSRRCKLEGKTWLWKGLEENSGYKILEGKTPTLKL